MAFFCGGPHKQNCGLPGYNSNTRASEMAPCKVSFASVNNSKNVSDGCCFLLVVAYDSIMCRRFGSCSMGGCKTSCPIRFWCFVNFCNFVCRACSPWSVVLELYLGNCHNSRLWGPNSVWNSTRRSKHSDWRLIHLFRHPLIISCCILIISCVINTPSAGHEGRIFRADM